MSLKRSSAVILVGLVIGVGAAVSAPRHPRQDTDRDAAATPPVSTDLYEVDVVHSSVVFRIKHLDVSYAYGRFNDIAGTYRFDPAAENGGFVDIQVKTASVDTNNENRDKHLRSADFFEVEKFPTLSFKTTSIKPRGDKFVLTGEFSLHGVSKAISVEAEYLGHRADPWGGYRSGFQTTFTIARSDFGMTAFAPPALGDEVAVTVSIEGVKK